MDGRELAPGAMIRALQRPECYSHPCEPIRVLETHLSWVLLTGPWAYKIKKPVNLGFADFSTLARRRRFCREEFRLNRRLAPQLYRDVVVITGTADAPRVGGSGPALDYAVRMVQFPQERLAARLLEQGRLEPRHFDALALDVAGFHARAPRVRPARGHGAAAVAQAAALQNFSQLRALPGPWQSQLARLEPWTVRRYAAIAPSLERRRRGGCVRECHGDLHLGNLALLDDRLVMFDRIEFDPALRWIDTASEAAFVVMDLLRRGADAFAWRFLNAWLEASGDYAALGVLDYFLVYRAMVRVKVAALRAAQCADNAAQRDAALAEAQDCLRVAARCARRRTPALFITHGVSGSGKTTLTTALVERLGLIRLRSDVERKRLFGLPGDARSGAGLAEGIYAADATARTYAALADRAAAILAAGYGVVVDATFLARAQRAPFAALARRLGCPFRVLTFDAPVEELRRRVAARLAAGDDASEADAAVLEAQLQRREAPGTAERASTIAVDTTEANAAARLCTRLMQVNAGRVPPPTLKPRPHGTQEPAMTTVSRKARAPRRTGLDLECPECERIVHVPRGRLIENTTLRCPHCALEAELVQEYDEASGRHRWLLAEPVADDEEPRRSAT